MKFYILYEDSFHQKKDFILFLLTYNWATTLYMLQFRDSQFLKVILNL